LGNPVLPGVIATIDFSVDSQTEVGDHYFVVGRVHSLHHEANVPNAMVFFRGKVVSAEHPG
jgi:flavin reductase (DIM6/NTAB) family NADH-FMN oxidoreductase RutF